MSPAPLAALIRARSFAAFARALSSLGLDLLADRPLRDWLASANLDQRDEAALTRLVTNCDLDTVGDLLAVEDRRVLRLAGGQAIVREIYPRLLASLAVWVAREAQRVEPTDRAADRPRAGLPEADLRAWAAERGVDRWLDVPAAAVAEKLNAYDRYLLWSVPQSLTVAGLIGAETRQPRRHPRAGEVSSELQQAALRWLEDRVRQAREDLAWERERLQPRRPATDDPLLLALWERLQAARAALRPGTMPRKIPEPARYLELQDDPPALIYEEPVQGWCRPGHRPTLEIDLRAEPLAVTCDCPEPAGRRPDLRGRCPMALSALDAALEVLSAPGPEIEAYREAIQAALAVCPWERALGELDDVLARHGGRDEKGRELGWRLTWAPGDLLRVMPVLCTPYATKSGLRVAVLEHAALRNEPWRCRLGADEHLRDLLPAAGERPPRQVVEQRAVRMVELLVGHPRVVLGAQHPVHVQVRREPLGFRLAEAPDGGLDLLPTISGAPQDARASLARIAATSDGKAVVLAAEEQRVILLLASADGLDLLRVLARRGTRFPADAAPALLARVPALAERVTLDLSAGLGFEEVPADPRLVLRLEAQPDATLRIEAMLRPIEDAPALVPGEGARQVWVLREQGYRAVRRALDDEPEVARRQLADLALPLPDGDALVQEVGAPEVALGILAALREREDRCAVEWAGAGRPVVTRGARASDLSVTVGAQRDWFGLGGELVVDGHSVPFSELMQAVLEGRRFVRATGQAWVQLGKPFLERLQALGDHVEVARGALRVAPTASPLMEELEAAGARLDAPPAWRDWLARLRHAQDLTPVVPASLVPILRPYQATAFTWLVRTASWSPGACLADDMGLGKTLQALALLVERSALGPALVVAPTSVGFGWLREAARFTPGLRLHLLRGPERARALDGLGPGDVAVTSYALLARDEAILAGRTFATLVLDEAQAIKNPDTQRAHAARAVQADFRLALTGTPIENRTSELWSVFRVTVPGLLGSWPHFRERFAVPIERDHDGERRRALAAVVRPFVLRRLKREVEPELPPRTEVQLTLDLAPAERAFYEQIRLATLTRIASGPLDDTTGRIQVLAALTRLRQAACHPRLVDPTSKLRSTKLMVLRERIATLRENGHRALVFSQFTSLLERARRALEQDGVRCRYLDGSLSPAARQVEVDAFQAGEADAFLISLKAGGTGLNLTAATYVFHLDPWWNPAVEDQATDRAHRIGQQRPVTVYRMVARGTVEEAILDLHASKRELVAGLLEGTGTAAKLATEELVDLLRFGGGMRDDDPVEPDESDVLAEPDDEPPASFLRLLEPPPGDPTAEPAPTARPDLHLIPAAGLNLRASFEAWRDSGVRDLAPSSMAVYARAVGRMIAWAEARGQCAVDTDGLLALVAAYRDEVEAGDWPDSRSTVTAASAAVGRWARWLRR